MEACLGPSKPVWVAENWYKSPSVDRLVPRPSTPLAIYPFLVHLRRYTRVTWQLHRPNSRQFEPIEPLAVAAEHSQGRPEIFNTPGVDLG